RRLPCRLSCRLSSSCVRGRGQLASNLPRGQAPAPSFLTHARGVRSLSRERGGSMRSALGVIALAAAAGCTFNPKGSPISSGQPGAAGMAVMTTGAGGQAGGGPTGAGGAMLPVCQNLECQQTTCRAGACTVPPCTAGARTTVSGTVYDPAGKV